MPSSFTPSLSDSAAGADALTRLLADARALADGAAAVDSLGRGIVGARSLVDGAVAADLLSEAFVGVQTRINPYPIGSAGVVPRPLVTVAPLVPPPPPAPFSSRLAVSVWSRAGTKLADFASAFAKTWQHQRSDAGMGTFSIQNDDTNRGQLPYRSIVRFVLDGSTRFASIIEDKQTKTVAPGEEHDQIIVVKGRGTLGIFEEALVYPLLGLANLPFSDVRIFNYSSPNYDASGWLPPVIIKNQANPFDPYSAAPAQWPAPDADWIWGVGGALPYPVGDCYFRKTLTLATEQTVRFFASADDGFVLYVDGAILMQDQQAYLWGNTNQADVFLTAGTHTVAIKGTNIARPGSPATNSAAVIAAAFILDGDGTLGAELVKTDATWACSIYPTVVPGFTAGDILLQLVAEAQSRGTLTGIVADFTATNDSSGAPWNLIGEQAFNVGDDYLTAILNLCQNFIDVEMDPGALILRAYNKIGKTTAVAFVPHFITPTPADNTVNVTALEHEGVV